MSPVIAARSLGRICSNVTGSPSGKKVFLTTDALSKTAHVSPGLGSPGLLPTHNAGCITARCPPRPDERSEHNSAIATNAVRPFLREPATKTNKLSAKPLRPFSDFLTDNYSRQHDYLRISLTERCNLRCTYCMPEEGVPLSPTRDLLTTPEVYLLAKAFVSQGVTKIRLTGGEPTVRRDIVPLMQQLGSLRSIGLKELCITTNGIALHRKLEAMVEAGLTGVNLSLDTLDPWQFQIMTRRNGFDAVQRSAARILELNKAGAGIKFKINCVVMRGINDREILDFVAMTRETDVEVRFIEYMPFDGNKWSRGKMFSYDEMLDLIREQYPSLAKVKDDKNDTSKTWHIPGFTGRLGFVTSMTSNFCGTCNRLRITSDGNLKVCLFGNTEVSLRDVIRKVNGGEPIDAETLATMQDMTHRCAPESNADGYFSQAHSSELLEVIGAAVKRKKAKHAGLGTLEHMENRPMILIEPITHTLRSLDGAARTQHTLLRTRPLSVLSPNDFMLSSRLSTQNLRLFSSTRQHLKAGADDTHQAPSQLTHVSNTGSAHMVSIVEKVITTRKATAACAVIFSAGSPALGLIRDNMMKKGDVLGIARIAGIMAAKKTSELIPLCHPIALSQVTVQIEPQAKNTSSNHDRLLIEATVVCEGKTGVEMEALSAASVAALTVYDMCKAVDKGMRIEGLRVVLKEGGKSGRWIEGEHITA